MHPCINPPSRRPSLRSLKWAPGMILVAGVAGGIALGTEDSVAGSNTTGSVRVPAASRVHAEADRLSDATSDGPPRMAAVDEVAAAARGWLASLDDAQRSIAAKPFEDAARLDWHFVPRERAGLELLAMSLPQRARAMELLRSTLSIEGASTVDSIMALETVLHELEEGRGPRRDSLGYAFAVFGTPGQTPWGWEVEGHHLSLNFTFVGDGVATTPRFLGANPASVRSGPHSGLRALGRFEDGGREFVRSLDARRRGVAVIAGQAPTDIFAVPGRGADDMANLDTLGVAASDLTDDQRESLLALIERASMVLHGPLAEVELARMMNAPLDSIRFAWMGGLEPGEGHYYRLVGPTFLIEYDNTQNRAEHIHMVWRDRTRDFGDDLLAEHLRAAHEKSAPGDPITDDR